MKLFTPALGFLLALFIGVAEAQQRFDRAYGVATTIDFVLFEADGGLDVDEVDGDNTGASEEVTCEGNEATQGGVADSSFVDEGSYYSLALTATEMSFARIECTVVSTAEVEVLLIETNGNASAQHPVFPANVLQWNTTPATLSMLGLDATPGTLNGTHTSKTADIGANAPVTAVEVVGHTLLIPAHNFARVITAYNEGTGVATFASTAETLANADAWVLIATPRTDIAAIVWNALIATYSGTAGSTAEQLAAAGAAGDPWATALPGAYTSGQAGNIIGNNVNATISSRASQTAMDTANLALARMTVAEGTCDSGSATQCVDDALTQVAAAQLEGRMICFEDDWCENIDVFTPGSPGTITHGTAPSSRSGMEYTVYPSYVPVP